MGTIYFNGKDLCEEFNMNVLGRGTYGSPARDIEQVHVPGRNGDLLFDNGGFLNQTVTYPECSILENFPFYGAQLRNFLLSSPGYHELRDTYDPRYYRLAEYRGPFEPDVHTARDNDSAVFDLSFNCKPFRYLREPGKIVLMAGSSTYEYARATIPGSADGSYHLRLVNGGSAQTQVYIYKLPPAGTAESLASITVAAGAEETVDITTDKDGIVYAYFLAKPQTDISIYSGAHLIYSFSGPTNTAKIYNDTHFDADPLIDLTYFSGSITVNGRAITYSKYSSARATIDSDEQTAYDSTENVMYNVGGVFPTLQPGLNTITCTADQSGSGTLVRCSPRLRTL